MPSYITDQEINTYESYRLYLISKKKGEREKYMIPGDAPFRELSKLFDRLNSFARSVRRMLWEEIKELTEMNNRMKELPESELELERQTIIDIGKRVTILTLELRILKEAKA